MKEKFAIAFITDDAYAAFTSTAIYSIIVNRNRAMTYNIYIFFTNLSNDKIEILAALKTCGVNIHFIDLKDEVSEYQNLFYIRAHYTAEVYFRFFISKFLNKFYDYIIYLDDDLVVNCDVCGIFDEIDKTTTINGVLNFSTGKVAQRLQTLNLSYEQYINAGVLVIDSIKFEQKNYLNKAMECLSRNRNLTCLDQDILNIICKGDIGFLPATWNYQWHNLNNSNFFPEPIRKYIAVADVPNIIHYTSDKKPWNSMLNKYGKYFIDYSSANPVYKLLL